MPRSPIEKSSRESPTMSAGENKKTPPLPPSESTRTTTPHDNDVLCGRGGNINCHPGNEQYRKFVERKKRIYLTARFKREKRLIASSIVEEIRKLDPPGRFLIKESPSSNVWHDIGDEKARDKTSQALRENAISVRKEMEEEYNETRRQQAREEAIAAGRDPDEAVATMSAKVSSSEAEARGPELGVDDERGKEIIIPKPGFGRSGYGPLYDAQQPQRMHPAGHGHPPSGMPPPWGYAPPPGYDPRHPPPPHFPPQSPYYPPPINHQPFPYHQPRPSHQPPPPSHHPHPPSTIQYPPYHAGWGSSVRSMPPVPPNSQQIMPPHPTSSMPPPQILTAPSMHSESSAAMSVPLPPHAVPSSCSAAYPTVPPQHLSHQQDHKRPTGTLESNPGLSSRSISPGEDRHVQFKSQISKHRDPKRNIEDTEDISTLSSNFGIPLVISSKKRSHTPQPRRQPQSPSPSSSADASAPSSPISGPYSITSQISPAPYTKSPTSAHLSASQAGLSQATPLTFASNPSVKSSDSISHILRGLEDDITGDVGQEVELVAHAPMSSPVGSDRRQYYHRSDKTSSSSSSSKRREQPSSSSRQRKATPPRHSSRRRRRSAGHIPSNSGKVQVDWSSAGRGAPKNSNCATVNSCGLPLPPANILPAPLVGRVKQLTQQQRHSISGVQSPVHPMSPVNSLDLEKMSLCGTEVVSNGGGSLGGASLCNVFEEQDSVYGASVLMDMSIGSHPSSAGSIASPINATRIAAGAGGNGFSQSVFSDQESFLGASALMDMSVGSSKALSNDGSGSVSSKQHATIHKSGSNKGSESTNTSSGTDVPEPAPHGQDFVWTWDGKSKE